MSTAVSKPRGRHFFANPGPTNIPDSVLRAIDRPIDRFPRPGLPRGLRRVLRGREARAANQAPPVHVHRLRPRRVGGVADQPAVTWRRDPVAGVRLFFRRMGEDGSRAEGRGAPGCRRLAPWRRYRRREGCAGRGHQRTLSRRCAWCTTRPRPGCSSRSPRCARRSMRRSTRRCCWSIPSRRSARSTSAWTSGRSMP